VIAQDSRTSRAAWVATRRSHADVHAGRGATVGYGPRERDAVAPDRRRVDIGAHGAVETRLRATDLTDNLRALRNAIERAIPGYDAPPAAVGGHEGRSCGEGQARWNARPARGRAEGLASASLPGRRWAAATTSSRWLASETGRLMLHAGSFAIGKRLATTTSRTPVAQPWAKPGSRRTTSQCSSRGTKAFDAYRHDLFWAQE